MLSRAVLVTVLVVAVVVTVVKSAGKCRWQDDV